MSTKFSSGTIIDSTWLNQVDDLVLAGPGGGGTEYLVENYTGTLPTASGLEALALGPSSQADGDHSIAIGQNADANSVGFGTHAGISIGRDSYARGNKSIAIGSRIDTEVDRSTNSYGENSIAVGPGAQVGEDGQDGIAIGNSATAAPANSIAIGSGAQVSNNTHTGSVVIGMATSDAANQVVLADGQGNVFLRTGLNGAPAEHADDAAAATGGVPIGGFYRTGSVLKVRVS